LGDGNAARERAQADEGGVATGSTPIRIARKSILSKRDTDSEGRAGRGRDGDRPGVVKGIAILPLFLSCVLLAVDMTTNGEIVQFSQRNRRRDIFANRDEYRKAPPETLEAFHKGWTSRI
jgi:hypothetical protein